MTSPTADIRELPELDRSLRCWALLDAINAPDTRLIEPVQFPYLIRFDDIERAFVPELPRPN
jgi:hypothetical protein